MPEHLRIDYERDLDEAGVARMRPVAAEMAETEQRWVRDGDEVAYRRWMELLSVASAIVAEHYQGPSRPP